MFERFRTLFGFETRSTLADPGWDIIAALGAAHETAAGVSVSPATALRSPTALAAIRCIAETIGALPIQVFERKPDGSRERTSDHPAAVLLAGDFCPWSSSAESRIALQFDALQHGVGYGQVVRVNGQVAEIHRIEPTAVTPLCDSVTMEPSYRIRQAKGPDLTLPWSDVLNVHVPGSAWNRPISLTALASNAIGLDIAMAHYQSALFKSGARPGGVLEYPGFLGGGTGVDKEAIKEFRASLERSISGMNAGKTLVLENGMKFTPLSFSSVDLQFLELRRFVVQEIARVYRVPATFLGDLERATWRNTEELSRQFLTFTLLPWLDIWQSALSRVLFTPQERLKYFCEFQTADLLRGDTAARFAAYRNSAGGSWMTPNEVRQLENLPPIDGGNTLVKQAGQSGAIPAPTAGDGEGELMMEHLDLAAGEVRFDTDSATGVLSGHAAIFGQVVPRYNEMVQAGAFARSLAEHRAAGTRPVMLWGHDSDHPIGVWTDLAEDERGLRVTGKLIPGVAKADEARALLSGGAINGLSIGFRKRSDFKNAAGVRVLTDVDLGEISLCAFPAAPGARVTSFRTTADPAGIAAFIEAARRTARSLRS